jgi:hypothetical protein
MQPRYVISNSSLSTLANWTPLDWWRDPIQISLAISDSGAAGWALNVTFDDPTGFYPNPVKNPGNLGVSGAQGVGGKNVVSFASSQVGGWNGTSPGSSAFPGYCFPGSTGAALSGSAVGGITQPIAALQFCSSGTGAVLTILQAGPR